MSYKIKIPTPLRRHTDGQSLVEVPNGQANATISTTLAALTTQYPSLDARLFDGQGHVKTHINIFLNNEDIRFLKGLDTSVKDGDTVVLLPALAGG